MDPEETGRQALGAGHLGPVFSLSSSWWYLRGVWD